jgi:hypothetical protein
LLQLVPIGTTRRQVGTVVDFTHHIYNQDKRLAHMPYHALTPTERDTFNARKAILAHLSDLLRRKAVEKIVQQRRMGERPTLKVPATIRQTLNRGPLRGHNDTPFGRPTPTPAGLSAAWGLQLPMLRAYLVFFSHYYY